MSITKNEKYTFKDYVDVNDMIIRLDNKDFFYTNNGFKIYDDYDEVEPDHAKLTKLTNNSYEADGEIYVDDLFEELEIGAAPDDTTKTLSAWLFEQFEIIPNVGDTKVIPVSFTKLNEDTGDYEDFNKNVIFEVTETDEVRITTVKITIEDRREEEDNDINE